MSDEGDPDVGVDEVGFVEQHRLLDGGEHPGVHAGQVLGAVQDDAVRRALPLHGHAGRQQQVPAEEPRSQSPVLCFRSKFRLPVVSKQGLVWWRNY